MKNIGPVDSPSFHIQFQILQSGNESDAAMQTEDRNVSGEAAGEAKQVDFNVPAGFSDRAVRLVIDYDNKVAESNEQNNSVAMSKVGAFPSAGGGTPTPKPAGLPDMAAVLEKITPKADGGMRYRFTSSKWRDGEFSRLPCAVSNSGQRGRERYFKVDAGREGQPAGSV